MAEPPAASGVAALVPPPHQPQSTTPGGRRAIAHALAVGAASPPARSAASSIVHAFPTPGSSGSGSGSDPSPAIGWASPPEQQPRTNAISSAILAYPSATPPPPSNQTSPPYPNSNQQLSAFEQQQLLRQHSSSLLSHSSSSPPYVSDASDTPNASATPVPLSYSSHHSLPSGAAGGPRDFIKQRRVGAEQLQHRESIPESGYESDSKGKHSFGASAAPAAGSATSDMYGRKIVRVSSRRHHTSWSSEARAMLTTVLGQRTLKSGKHNPSFYVRLIALLAILLFLLVWALTSGSGPRVVPLPPAPAHVLSAIRRASELHSSDEHGHPLRRDDGRPPLTSDDVTIFTVHTPEVAHEHNLHVRAIHSWVLRVPSPTQVHVYVRDHVHCRSVQELGVTCRVSSCWDPHFDAPRLTCLLAEANRRSRTELMLYVDNHLVLFEDLMPALMHVGRMEHFVMLGRSDRLTMQLDEEASLETWQRDLEASLFLDASSEQEQDLLGQSQLEGRMGGGASKSYHYIAYARTELDVSILPAGLLMDSGNFLNGHGWESSFLATLLVQNELHVIDASQAVSAIEFGHADATNHTAIINAANRDLSRSWTGVADLHQEGAVNPLSLGRLENAHFVLTGRCPTCQLKENREADLPLLLLRNSNPQRQVIVIATNAHFLALSFNWICRARQLGVSNFIFLAEDRVSYRILRKMNVGVVLRKDAPLRKSQAASVGSRAFQETLYLRALLFHQIVTLGFSLISTHLDTMWFMNPLPMLANPDCDMFVQMERGTGGGRGSGSSGGLMSIRANEVGRAFVKDYLACEQENWHFLLAHGKPRFSFSDDAELDCVELISTRLMRRSGLKRCVLDPLRYVSEADFFDAQLPQRRAVWPLFVHLNQAKGVANKTRAFSGWNLWGVDDDRMALESTPRVAEALTHGRIHCIPPTPTISPPEGGEEHGVHVVIYILASTEVKAMELTFLSLTSATYPRSMRVDLHLTLQQPPTRSAENSAAFLALHKLFYTYSWKHGSKSIVVLDRFVDESAEWINAWSLSASNDAFILPLAPGFVLSPVWASWVMQALRTYYFDPFAFDPRMMGISLVHQMLILGESPAERFGSRVPSQELAKDREEYLLAHPRELNATKETEPMPTHHMYLYQFVPLRGTVFFPKPFGVFLQWYLTQNVSTTAASSASSPTASSPSGDDAASSGSDATSPPSTDFVVSSSQFGACTPTLYSNTWVRQDPQKHWWVWLTRFTFESGFYGLYTNFHSEDPAAASKGEASSGAPGSGAWGPRALLVDDQPTAGSLSISLIFSLTPEEQLFPSRPNLTLWDLHMDRFDLPSEMLGRRKLMFPPVPGSSSSMREAIQAEESIRTRGDVMEAGAGSFASLRPHFDFPRHVHSHDEELEDPTMAEQDISHLDVMIEEMVREMEERQERSRSAARGEIATGTADEEEAEEGETEGHKAGKPSIAQLRARASSRSQARSSLRAHRAHHSPPPRGLDSLPRCFLVSDQLAMAEAREEEEAKECKGCYKLHASLRGAISRQIALKSMERREAFRQARKAAIDAGQPLPTMPKEVEDPMASYLTSPVGAEELYELMYRLALPHLPTRAGEYTDVPSGKGITRVSPPRFVLYQPSRPAPFDGHLRGIYFAFLLALFSNRILMIDLPDLHLQYECPFEGAEWDWVAWKGEEKLGHVEKVLFDSKRSADLRTSTLDLLYHEPLLVYADPMAHDRVLFKNADYTTASTSLFGSSSRMRRTGAVMKLLLGKPREALVKAATEMQRNLGLVDAKHTLSVHVAVPSSLLAKPSSPSDPLPGIPGRYWDCVRSFMLSLGWVGEEVVILFSTNKPSPDAFALAEKELGRFGHVVTPEESWDTQRTSGGVSDAQKSSSVARDAQGRAVIDPALVLGYLLGEAEVSISSGTTFGLFHAARTGFKHQALMMKLAPPPKKGATQTEEDYCGPMHRLDFPMPEDISF